MTFASDWSARARCLAVLIASLWAAPTGSVRAQAPDVGTEAQREAGKALYLKYCAQCHGEKGDGEGYATPHLRPRPRDFTTGKFKVRTTPNGALPTHQDLVNIIRRGMPYTSMPAWPDLSDQEVSDIAYFLTTFSPDFAKAENVPQPVPLPSAPNSTNESDRAREEALRGERLRQVPRHARPGRWSLGANAEGRLGLSDPRGRPRAALDLPGRVVTRGHLQDDEHGVERHADAVVRSMRCTPEQRWAITDFIASLSGSDGARLHQPRRRQVRPGADRSEEGSRELRGRSCRPLSDHRTDHGARTRVPSTRDLRDGAGHLRCRVGRRPRALARHEPGEDWQERAVASRAGGGRGRSVSGRPRAAVPRRAGTPLAMRKSRRRRRAGAQPPAADPFAEEPTAPAGQPSEFSDAVAIQIPSEMPTDARKPYFIFGDSQSSVDLWFFDLALPEPAQFTGRGSADIKPSDAKDLTGVASYDQGEWSVIFKRPLRPASGAAFSQGQFLPIAVLGLGRVRARAWQQARAHGLVLRLRRGTGRPVGCRPDGEDGADHSRSRAGRDRLGAVALRLPHPRRSRLSRATRQPRAREGVSTKRAASERSDDPRERSGASGFPRASV